MSMYGVGSLSMYRAHMMCDLFTVQNSIVMKLEACLNSHANFRVRLVFFSDDLAWRIRKVDQKTATMLVKRTLN